MRLLRSWKLRQVSKMDISRQLLMSYIWAMGTLEGLLSFHNVHALGWGWRSKSRTLKKNDNTAFCFMLTPPEDIRSDISHPYDPAFHVMR